MGDHGGSNVGYLGRSTVRYQDFGYPVVQSFTLQAESDVAEQSHANLHAHHIADDTTHDGSSEKTNGRRVSWEDEEDTNNVKDSATDADSAENSHKEQLPDPTTADLSNTQYGEARRRSSNVVASGHTAFRPDDCDDQDESTGTRLRKSSNAISLRSSFSSLSLESSRRPWEKKHRLPWAKRMKHVTWAYFTLTMATGGVANVLYAAQVLDGFRGLYTIGLVFFFLNIFLYIIIWGMIITRFTLYPHMFRDSFTHPTESLFVPAFAVSLGTILITIVEYGADHAGPWLTHAVLVLFWLDSALAVILSITIYMILWSSTSFTIAQMTPIWIFPAYPLLIIGPHAANLSARLPSAQQTIQVIVGGFTIQGIGFLVSLTIYSAFVYRLMTEKLPAERLRPGMFVSVGPSAFTVSGTIGMAEHLHRAIDTDPHAIFLDVPALLAAQILRLVATWMSLWLWGLALWFFFVSLVSNMQCFRAKHRVPFAMTWFSFIFPQTALCTSTFAIARAFDIYALKVIGCVMTVLLVIVWIFVVVMMIRAILRHDILWPERGEDKEEGGFRRKSKRRNLDDVAEAAAAVDAANEAVRAQILLQARMELQERQQIKQQNEREVERKKDMV